MPPCPKNRSGWSVLLLALVVVFGPTMARAEVLPEAPVVDTLPNGLRLVTVRWPSPGIVSYYTLVRAGSRDEVEPGKTGFAHLFEHMMFRGTEAHPAEEYERIIQSTGADNNAFTTNDFTLFTVTVPRESLPEIVELEADRFQHLAYGEPAFQTETRAVLGEYNKNASSPDQQMWETLAERAFTHHTYGHTAMGYLRDIQRMPGYYAFSRQFFERFYRPDDCIIFAVGDVDRQALRALVTEKYGAWSGHRDANVVAPEPEQTEPREAHLQWASATPPKVLLAYRVPAFSTASVDTAALRVLYELAFGSSSDLYQRLVVDEQKLLSLGENGMDLNRDPGLLVVDAELREGTRFEEIEQAVTQELARIAGGQLPASRIEEVKSHVRYQIQVDLETPDDVAVFLASYAAMDGAVDSAERFMTRLAEVTAADVARVAREQLTPAHRTIVTLATGTPAPAPAPPAPGGGAR